MSDHIPPADLSYWDDVQSFTLTEAAWLWCGLEPPHDGLEFMPNYGISLKPHPVIQGLPARGQRAARAMWKDIWDHESDNRLLILTEWPDTHYKIPRKYLREWADKRGEKPSFLFPERRIQASERLTLEGALQIISALAKAVDSRWKPGNPAPYGMVKRLAEVAGSVGLRLDRNTIGKYLKEAGNKNISA